MHLQSLNPPTLTLGLSVPPTLPRVTEASLSSSGVEVRDAVQFSGKPVGNKQKIGLLAKLGLLFAAGTTLAGCATDVNVSPQGQGLLSDRVISYLDKHYEEYSGGAWNKGYDEDEFREAISRYNTERGASLTFDEGAFNLLAELNGRDRVDVERDDLTVYFQLRSALNGPTGEKNLFYKPFVQFLADNYNNGGFLGFGQGFDSDDMQKMVAQWNQSQDSVEQVHFNEYDFETMARLTRQRHTCGRNCYTETTGTVYQEDLERLQYIFSNLAPQ